MIIRVMLYGDIPGTVPVDSEYAGPTLMGLHPNIHVIRHPGKFRGLGTDYLYWSHHEKTIIIDQTLAFVGGIDLAFG